MRILGYEIHRLGKSPATMKPTQQVHRERKEAFKASTADLLAHYQAERGKTLPAVERIVK